MSGYRFSQKLILVLWATGLTLLSLLPLHMKHALGTSGIWHDAAHLLCFAVTGVLFLHSKRLAGGSALNLWPVVLFAFILEWLECTIYAGQFEWKDIFVDILGLIAAAAITRLRVSQASR